MNFSKNNYVDDGVLTTHDSSGEDSRSGFAISDSISPGTSDSDLTVEDFDPNDL